MENLFLQNNKIFSKMKGVYMNVFDVVGFVFLIIIVIFAIVLGENEKENKK